MDILTGNHLNTVDECLNDMAVEGLVSNESVSHFSALPEKTRYFFEIFKKALQVEKDREQASNTQIIIAPILDQTKGKKDSMAVIG
ncbi:histone deacetylase 5-like [Pyrus ussuriensis x Pyrus communis]|uniref:Histone deacetylase 5-like n=1 Tax=Pyrus ussuriensis x Pyrus communis TaxID=2448454 RepID=A0A5N5FB44_9ROSA|nr:histone deacetylase 5-like [Pyrus ussuriensis x Pyrus communis]